MSQRLSLEGLLLLIGMTLGWGINWPIMKSILTEIPPLSFRGFCLCAGGLGILILAKIAGHSLNIPQRYWRQVFWICLFNIFAWNLMATYGLSLLPAGRSALLGYTMPIWAVLLSVWVLNERFSARTAIALALGLLGILVLMSDQLILWMAHQNIHTYLFGAGLMVAAAWCWALGTNLMKRWALPIHSMVLTGWLLCLASLPMIAAAFIIDPPITQLPSTFSGWGVVYNVFIAFMFCYWAWVRIIEITPVAISSLSSLITPLVGVFSSLWILHEIPGWREYTATALILTAVVVINGRWWQPQGLRNAE